MTTPEKVRRRERVLGVGLVICGLLVALSTYFGDKRDDKQDRQFKECITSVVGELTDSLTARSNLTEPAAQSVRDLISELLASKSEADSRKAIKRYNETQADLAKVRENNPIPPFPDGTCDHK